MVKKIHVFRHIGHSGVEIKIKQRRFPISYPISVWERFPRSLHRLFADGLAYISTWHLPFQEEAEMVYHFSHPPIEPVFFKIIFYTIPMNIFEFGNVTTSQLLRKHYNANFLTQFKGLNHSYSGKKLKKRLKERAIILFSFGKDSLLTHALTKELGISPFLIFMKEPQSVFENAHKRKLAQKFYHQSDQETLFFPLSIGKLRQEEDFYWGWDIALSQYAYILIPYFFYYQAKYLFFGNEQSCNFYTQDKESYFVNPVFEQSTSSMQFLQDIPKLFFINTHIGSLVEPIHEILVTFILHHRYPEAARYQMSCFAEEEIAKNKRWCGCCEKCARIYIFFKALNINPEKVGFYNSKMLSLKKEKYYIIFNNNPGESAYGGSGLGRDEQLLAFYLAYKRGVKGELIDKFKSLYLAETEKKLKKLIDEYFGIHSFYSYASGLRRKVLRIFEKERQTVLRQIKKIIFI
jgi:hypothetical protein